MATSLGPFFSSSMLGTMASISTSGLKIGSPAFSLVYMTRTRAQTDTIATAIMIRIIRRTCDPSDEEPELEDAVGAGDVSMPEYDISERASGHSRFAVRATSTSAARE